VLGRGGKSSAFAVEARSKRQEARKKRVRCKANFIESSKVTIKQECRGSVLQAFAAFYQLLTKGKPFIRFASLNLLNILHIARPSHA